MKLTLKVLSVAVLGAASTLSFAEEPAAEHTVSGNISVLSSYNLRGITNAPENSGATLQGGLDYNHASGFYAGWWGSTLDYGDDLPNAFENDFYAGYNGAINEDWGYTAGLTYYYYYDIGNTGSNGFETMLGLTY
ncbi:MAG: TorF family putative porin, partial [Acinetobacter sp.]